MVKKTIDYLHNLEIGKMFKTIYPNSLVELRIEIDSDNKNDHLIGAIIVKYNINPDAQVIEIRVPINEATDISEELNYPCTISNEKITFTQDDEGDQTLTFDEELEEEIRKFIPSEENKKEIRLREIKHPLNIFQRINQFFHKK